MSEKSRNDLKLLFLKLCVDDTPFVRRAAAQNIISMIRVSSDLDQVSAADKLVDFIEAFKSFARDDQVRVNPLIK